MSTAGKVLVVLVMLMMAGWMVLISAVAQLNKNQGAIVAKNQKDLEALTKQADEAAKSIIATIEKAQQEQADTVRDLREVQFRIVAAEARQSATNASLARIKLQVANYEAALETARKNLAVREAEEAQANEAKAKVLAAIEASKAVNADLRDRLGKLQDEFKQILSENAKAVAAPPASSEAGTGARVARTARAL